MSGTQNRRAGIAYLSIDGSNYDVVSDAEYFANSVKRESLTGQSGVQGYSEMPVTGYISATIRDAGSLTVASFNAMTSSSLVLTLANGKRVYGDGMWCTEVEAVKTQEATFSVKFEGVSVEELTA
ncbi:phage tail tube protein [Acidocella sp.]|uniref:phage tail tube protein n=1 Tax=Acidocella sp. TaxID=50710 RepID=UPI00260C6AE0|nr:phage tail tube protein [Acidocella sp.]